MIVGRGSKLLSSSCLVMVDEHQTIQGIWEHCINCQFLKLLMVLGSGKHVLPQYSNAVLLSNKPYCLHSAGHIRLTEVCLHRFQELPRVRDGYLMPTYPTGRAGTSRSILPD